MKYIAFIAILALSGCATMQEQLVKHAKPLTDKYCMQPQQARELLRAEVNAALQPNSVKVTCAGDQPS